MSEHGLAGEQMHLDDFVGRAIQVARLQALHIEIEYTARLDERVRASVKFDVPARWPFRPDYLECKGRTMGFALRGLWQQIEEAYGLKE